MRQYVTLVIIFICGILAGALFSIMGVTHRDSYGGKQHVVVESSSQTQNLQAQDPKDKDSVLYALLLNNLTSELTRLREAVKQMNSTNRPFKEPMTHEEVEAIDAQRSSNNPVTFDDHHEHKDDDSVAKDLFGKVRVLCWIMTSQKTLESKARHVRDTWGKRCNKLLIMSDQTDDNFPAIGLGTDLGREHLTAKTMRAFDYVYKNHAQDADWFMKADDDTYVIVENLRYMLSEHKPSEPVFFGHHFKVIVNQGYFSGGAGYVLSKEALTRFAGRDASLCAKDHGAEDVEMGRCMERLGIKTGDSRDKLGRSRFHCFTPETHLHGGYPDWYRQYDKYGAQQGIEVMSDYPVTFHYVSTDKMYDLEYFIYHAGPYGIIKGLQDLNRNQKASNATVHNAKTTTTTTKAPIK